MGWIQKATESIKRRGTEGVCTGDKFDEWYVDNLLYMVEKHGNLKYDKCHVIRDGEGNVYDKLQMFRDFTDDVNYLYFDLDVVIKLDDKRIAVIQQVEKLKAKRNNKNKSLISINKNFFYCWIQKPCCCRCTASNE